MTIQIGNPLSDYAATFDLFYQFVKGQVGGLVAEQYIQIKAVAEPFDLSKECPWFSYYTYLLRSDVTLEPAPLSGFAVSDRTLSDEFGSFVENALNFVEKKELDAETIKKINDLSVLLKNIKDSVKDMAKQDMNDWKEYSKLRGISYGDPTAFTQWTFAFGNGNEISQKQRQKMDIEGDLARLRAKEYPDPNQKEIKDVYNHCVSGGSRLRYPRRPDTEYTSGKLFNLDYLTNVIAPGDTALFNDRLAVFPAGLTLDAVLTTSLGHFDVKIDSHTSATDSMTTDWHAGGSAGSLWFSVSAESDSHTQIKEEFQNTTGIEISCKACFAIPMDATAWFKPGLFKNEIVQKNLGAFERYFGPNGTLLYYPGALIVMRGFKVIFKSSSAWNYDYANDFSASGSGSLKIFGIGFGGSYSQSEHTEKQRAEVNGSELTFDDGDQSIRVIGYVAQRNSLLHGMVMKPLHNSYIAAFGAL